MKGSHSLERSLTKQANEACLVIAEAELLARASRCPVVADARSSVAHGLSFLPHTISNLGPAA